MAADNSGTHACFFFFFSLGGSSRGIVATGQGHSPPKVRVRASLGSFCASPGGQRPQGARTHNLGGPWPRPAATIQREDHPRENKKAKIEREREKREKCWAVSAEEGSRGGGVHGRGEEGFRKKKEKKKKKKKASKGVLPETALKMDFFLARNVMRNRPRENWQNQRQSSTSEALRKPKAVVH